jgi:glycosyltransferase involved in cell wall biosynthesis
MKTNFKSEHLVFVGEVGSRKGTLELIAAFAETKPNSWKLHIVGPGQIAEAAKLSSRLRVEDSVIVHGKLSREDTERVVADARVLVLPSKAEGLPMAILEAMSAGLAILATDVGSTSDAVTSGVNGYLLPVQWTQTDLVKQLAWFMNTDNEIAVKQMGERSHQHWTNQFSIDGFALKLHQIYRRAQSTSSVAEQTP